MPEAKLSPRGSCLRRAARNFALLALLMAAGGCGSSATTTTATTSPPSPSSSLVTTVGNVPARRASADAARRLARRARAASPLRRGEVRARPTPPPIVWDPIPFGAQRRAEMVAYARRHYGSFFTPTWRLIHPQVIVIHYTDSPDFASTYATFAADVADVELHELPGTCAHFVIDSSGTIHQLVALGTMCRHTVGLNWTAIGIEHVGYSDGQVLGNRLELSASIRLVRWLQCRLHIRDENVIGHNESLSSALHHEDVAALSSQTHGDFNLAAMQIYRARLRHARPCR